MHIDKPQHKMPFDMFCPMLQIARGCTHNKCRFCNIFIDEPFSESPDSEIEEDLDELAETIRKNENRLYLTGGNPFALPMNRLTHILDMVKEKLPQVKRRRAIRAQVPLSA